VYIPNRKSKAGKRFAFVRFIKVDNVDRLVGNICTLWIGRMHIHANVVRFECSPIHSPRTSQPPKSDKPNASSYVSTVKGILDNPLSISSVPAMVLDDSCMVHRDLDNFVMGEIGSKWGEVLELEECKDDFFARKRICIKTKMEDNILEKFKIIVKRKIYVVRAKELFVWSPTFKDVPEMVYGSDDVSAQGVYVSAHSVNEEEVSYDAFNVYDLLKKHDKGVKDNRSSHLDTSISYPPCFTPKKENLIQVEQETNGEEHFQSHSKSEGCSSRTIEDAQKIGVPFSPEIRDNGIRPKKGASILDVLDDMIKVGQAMGFTMEGCSDDMKKIISLQGVYEVDNVDRLVGNLCTLWIGRMHIHANVVRFERSPMHSPPPAMVLDDSCMVHQDLDNFVMGEGVDVNNTENFKQANVETESDDNVSKTMEALENLIQVEQETNGEEHFQSHSAFILDVLDDMIKVGQAMGFTMEGCLDDMKKIIGSQGVYETMVMGDFNEVRHNDERFGSVFNVQGARAFNNFISSLGHRSDHRPILLREVVTDYGAIPFRIYQSWFKLHGFERLVTHTWNSTVLDDHNGMIQFKKKLQILKKEIRVWVMDQRKRRSGRVNDLKTKLCDIDKALDHGGVNEDLLLSRVMIDGECVDDPNRVKDEFCTHFAKRFHDPGTNHCRLNFNFPNRLNTMQAVELEAPLSRDVIRKAVWGCGENKSPGPDGFTLNFGMLWRSWIRGSLKLGMASILINGSPTSEFQFHCGLKQGDPLAPYLFILVMEALHLSFSRAINAGNFTGVKLDLSLMVSHLFYADDAVFVCQWSQDNLKGIMYVLHCFSLLSGLKINLKKSHLLGVGVPTPTVMVATATIGCSVMETPFNYLGIMVGGDMSLIKSWDDTVSKLKSRLSKWKLKTLSIGGRFTLLKSVLGFTPINSMSLYKVPKAVLHSMEAIRRNFSMAFKTMKGKLHGLSGPRCLRLKGKEV
nr:RNA-directed DNA polymerase, eukaryota [Tanacetum cinerariifolium]